MIRRVESWSPQLDELCGRDVFGTRTAGYFRTYGTEHPGVSFYAQASDDGVCTGVLSSSFGNGSLTVTSEADLSEWTEFVRFVGMDSLLCAREAAQSMGLPEAENGSVMRYFSSERIPKTVTVDPFDAAFSYREVYDLLLECGFALGGYEPWLGDLALRVRRGTANVLASREQTTVGTASVLFDSGSAVYLGAVATHPSARGRGIGGDLVLRLAQCGKRAEILCKAHRVSFYKSLGFEKIGEFSQCHFSE